MTNKMTEIDEIVPIVDRVQMGRLFRAARVIAGYERVEDAAHVIEERAQVKMSARTLYALERGEQMFSLDHVLAAAIAFQPPGGFAFFRNALRPDVLAMLNDYERRIASGNA